jgi:hypothetical protein
LKKKDCNLEDTRTAASGRRVSRSLVPFYPPIPGEQAGVRGLLVLEANS